MLSAIGKVAAEQHSVHALPVGHQRFMGSVPWEGVLQVILSLTLISGMDDHSVLQVILSLILNSGMDDLPRNNEPAFSLGDVPLPQQPVGSQHPWESCPRPSWTLR